MDENAPEDGGTPEVQPAPQQAPSTPYYRVMYTEQPGVPTPVFVVGRYWHPGTHFTVTQEEAQQLDGQPGFTRLGTADGPERRGP